jgi:hypothetical protein
MLTLYMQSRMLLRCLTLIHLRQFTLKAAHVRNEIKPLVIQIWSFTIYFVGTFFFLSGTRTAQLECVISYGVVDLRF